MIPDPERVELSARNRRTIAQRTNWPAGAVEACEKLEHEFAGFEVYWFAQQRSERPEFNREAGFYAWRLGEQPGQMWGNTWHGRHEWYGATFEELNQKMRGIA